MAFEQIRSELKLNSSETQAHKRELELQAAFSESVHKPISRLGSFTLLD